MALVLINLAGFSAGVAQDETSINIKDFKTVVEPEFNNVIPKKDGTARGRVVAPMKKNVSMSGEVSGAGAIMAASATVAFAPANTSDYWGAPSTGLYFLRGDVTENREGGALKEMSCELEAFAGIP